MQEIILSEGSRLHPASLTVIKLKRLMRECVAQGGKKDPTEQI
jgi:hypothetical protein